MLILFDLECQNRFFAKDRFFAVLDTSGKLSVYWSEQDQNKPTEQKFLQPWAEVYLFVMPDTMFAIGDLEFCFKPYLPSRLYDNPLIAHLNILEEHYRGRVERKGTCGEAHIFPKEINSLQITIDYPASLLDDLQKTSEQFEQEVRQEVKWAAAARLFEMKYISPGMAARLLGTDRISFLLGLHRYGVPMINLEEEEILYDLENA